MGLFIADRNSLLLYFYSIAILLVMQMAICGARTFGEAQVQCTANCLLKYRNGLSTEKADFLRKNPELVMLQCSKNSTVKATHCKLCINVCSKVKAIVEANNCNSFCQAFGSSPVCIDACKFVTKVLNTKPGTCPGPLSKLKKEGLQVRCTSDSDCQQPDTRCCRLRPNDRRSYCLLAHIARAEMPPIPNKPRVRRIKGKGRPMYNLDWADYNLESYPHPVVFLIQTRYYSGYVFDSSKATKWVDLVMTCRRSATIEDLKAGTWYQLRVGAMSIKGTLGYSQPTQPTRIKKDPRPPSPPRDLTEGTARIHGNMVDIEISWSPPRRSQTKIDRYKITWTKHYGYVTGGETQAAPKYDSTVPLSQTSYTLANLKPGTTYKVEISSVSGYGDTFIKSLPASMFVTTISIPSPASALPEPSESFKHFVRSSKCMCSSSSKTKSDAVVTKTPYYEKGRLRMAVLWNHPRPEDIEFASSSKSDDVGDSMNSYMIEWAPKVCVESSTANKPSYKPSSGSVHGHLIYYLNDLQFNCHYILRILGVSSSGVVRPLWDTCFCTPNCFDVRITPGHEPPECGANRDMIPDAPKNLKYHLERDERSNKYSVRLIWNPEIEGVESYRVLWGPRLPEPIDLEIYGRGITPLLDMAKAESKVVQGKKRSLYLTNLNESTVYIAHVQSVSTHGESAVASIFFLTPGRRKTKPLAKTVMYHIGVHNSGSGPEVSVHFTLTSVSISLLLTLLGTS